MCCNIKDEAVEDLKRGGIRPKQEVGRYVLKDVEGPQQVVQGDIYKSQRKGCFNFAKYEELRIGGEF